MRLEEKPQRTGFRSKRTRSFIAIDLPQDLKSKIEEVISRFKKYNYPVLWENPERAHITLVFLGHIAEERLKAAAEATKKAAYQTPPFELSTGPLEYFIREKGERGSSIHLKVEDPQKELREFYKKIFQNLTAEDFYPPERLQPHITIGRLKKFRNKHEQTEALEKLTSDEFEPRKIPVNQVNIYESISQARAKPLAGTDNKARYRLQRQYNLGGHADTPSKSSQV